MFRKASVVVQLAISIGFAFSTIIILKQMYFLYHSGELGFSFKNRGSITVYGENNETVADRLKQIPEIVEAVDVKNMGPLLPQYSRSNKEFDVWDEQPVNATLISLESVTVSPEYADFYDFRLVTGQMLTEADPETMVLLNEEAVKAFGWYEPVGKHFGGQYIVKGVIKNIYNFAPTIAIKPAFYLKPLSTDPQILRGGWVDLASDNPSPIFYYGRNILFEYHEGLWTSCKEKLELMKGDYNTFTITNAEEEYDNYLKSENNLIKLLSFVSAVCILICVFGFVSLVSLTCEERRKSIAIRKISGATTGDILAIFVKEYFLLLIIGAAFAFSAGYFIMQRWLEHYVKQTPIAAWVFLSILCVIAFVIVLCVGWKVYKASNENPAEAVKGE